MVLPTNIALGFGREVYKIALLTLPVALIMDKGPGYLFSRRIFLKATFITLFPFRNVQIITRSIMTLPISSFQVELKISFFYYFFFYFFFLNFFRFNYFLLDFRNYFFLTHLIQNHHHLLEIIVG